MDKECRNLENELKIMRIRSVSDQLSRTIARELDSEEQQTRYGYVNRYTFAMAAVFCVAAIIISVISYHAITVPKLPIPPPPPPPTVR